MASSLKWALPLSCFVTHHPQVTNFMTSVYKSVGTPKPGCSSSTTTDGPQHTQYSYSCASMCALKTVMTTSHTVVLSEKVMVLTKERSWNCSVQFLTVPHITISNHTRLQNEKDATVHPLIASTITKLCHIRKPSPKTWKVAATMGKFSTVP